MRGFTDMFKRSTRAASQRHGGVSGVIAGQEKAVAAIGYKELKKTGAFVVPGLAKFIVIKKPATKAPGHQSIHKGADGLQSEAGSQDRQGASGESVQRRRSLTRILTRPRCLSRGYSRS